MNLQKLALASSALAVALSAAVGAGLPFSPALSLGWYGAACDDAEAQNPGDPSGCRYDARERACGNGIDDDSDERTDGLDADCGACAAVAESCGNGQDDDCDGRADCGDPDCAADPSCTGCPPFSVFGPASWFCVPVPEICGNGQDDDGDGAADCQDPDCAGPQCGSACPPGTVPGVTPSGTYNCVPAVENCWNGTDDDGDGAVDCADSECSGIAGCISYVEVCGNGTDDDTDGLIDCADGECSNDPSCGGGCTGSFCECNPSDPSCQGDVCGDRTCSGEEDCKTCSSDCGKCPPKYEICGNGEDDDENGAADCEDQACSGTCECTNSCGDDTCDDSAACNYGAEGGCTYCECDGVDNNGDGTTDEEGEECPAGLSCIVISVSGINANGDFDAAVSSEISKSKKTTSRVSLGGTENADATAGGLESLLRSYYENDNPNERILVVAHSLGAIATHNMRQTYGGSYSDTTFLLYDPPYNYPGSANPMRWFSSTLRAIARARESGIAGSVTGNWTGGYDDPGNATEDANHVKFTSGSSVLTGIKDWVDGCEGGGDE